MVVRMSCLGMGRLDILGEGIEKKIEQDCVMSVSFVTFSFCLRFWWYFFSTSRGIEI